MCRRNVVFIFVLATLLSCQDDSTSAAVSAASETGRWYQNSQVVTGQTVFSRHCSACHGSEAQGSTDNWRQRLADGSFPPPPLNGTAHAWHHPLSVLLQTIDQGGAQWGGKMPAFGSVLSEQDKLAAIAYFQSFWNDENYSQWLLMGGEQ